MWAVYSFQNVSRSGTSFKGMGGRNINSPIPSFFFCIYPSYLG